MELSFNPNGELRWQNRIDVPNGIVHHKYADIPDEVYQWIIERMEQLDIKETLCAQTFDTTSDPWPPPDANGRIELTICVDQIEYRMATSRYNWEGDILLATAWNGQSWTNSWNGIRELTQLRRFSMDLIAAAATIIGTQIEITQTVPTENVMENPTTPVTHQ